MAAKKKDSTNTNTSKNARGRKGEANAELNSAPAFTVGNAASGSSAVPTPAADMKTTGAPVPPAAPAMTNPAATRAASPPVAPAQAALTTPSPTAAGALYRPAEADIRKRAYEIWVAKGCPMSQDHENWRQAEKELMAKLQSNR